MMRLAVVIALSCSIGAYADTVNAPGSSWFANSGPVADNAGNDGTPFWDNSSYDGNKCNVGYYLAGTETCQSPVPSGLPNANLSYLAATGSGGATAAGALTFNPGGSDFTTFVATFTGFSGASSGDEFGWTTDGVTLNQLFTVGVQSVGTTKTFAPTALFTYYLWNHTTGQKFFAGDPTVPNGGHNQFALFSQNPSGPTGTPPTGLTSYWIGVEDMSNTANPGQPLWPNNGCSTAGCGSDFDYNDIIVQVTTPEPGFLFLTGLGFAGLLGLRRLKKLV